MPAVVPACTRTMAVFEIFARERRELSNSEVARLLGVAETSCLDLLHTLVKCGYLTRTARTRRFYPTGRLLTISRQVSANDPLFAIANDALELLTEQTGETGLCGRIQDGAVGIVALREGRHSLRYILNVGDRIAAYPKRAALRTAPLWRTLMRARPADGYAYPDTHGEWPTEHADLDGESLEPFVDVHAFTPDELAAWARGAGFAEVRVRGEELLANWFGWINRTYEATAKPDDIPWLWRQYAFRGYLALQRVDVALLEGRLPAKVFYNLMIAGRKSP